MTTMRVASRDCDVRTVSENLVGIPHALRGRDALQWKRSRFLESVWQNLLGLMEFHRRLATSKHKSQHLTLNCGPRRNLTWARLLLRRSGPALWISLQKQQNRKTLKLSVPLQMGPRKQISKTMIAPKEDSLTRQSIRIRWADSENG